MKIMKIEDLGGEYISEQIIKRCKDTNIIYLTEDVILNTNCVKQLGEYIENLINRNKELEDKVKVFDKAVKCDKCDCNICEAEKLLLNSIPKSKVEEKIEELKNKRQNISDGSLDYQLRQYNYISCKIDILQELLEKE